MANPPYIFLIIPLVLSCFTHFWNPLGFLGPEHDENRYLQRALNLLDGMGPNDPKSSYDAPYFGQIFLAGVFRAVGYPQSLNPSANGEVDQIEVLWIIPRLVMSSLAVVDTFLVFKICERRYNKQTGLIASVIFAVLPITLLLLRMWLESILLPFLLSAILFAIYSKNSINGQDNNKKIIFIVLSGIFLGLAIFTKVTAFTMIPLLGFVIFNNHKSLRFLSAWFIPVILIPLIWPAYAYSIGEFDDWLYGIYHQTHRSGPPLFSSIEKNLKIDPVMLVVGSIGILYALIKRDYFLMLWVLPFMGFSYLIGWTQFFHIILILPALCIAAAKLIIDLPSRLKNKKFSQLLPFVITSGIGIFGLISTIEIITQDFTGPYFGAAAYINHYLDDVDVNNNQDRIKNHTGYRTTIISNPFYFWIPQYVFHLDHDYTGFFNVGTKIRTEDVVLVVDRGFRRAMEYENEGGEWLRKINGSYNNSVVSKIKDISILKYNVLSLSPQVNYLKLIDQNHNWKSYNDVIVTQKHNDLILYVNTTSSNSAYNHAYLSIDTNSTFTEPLFLTLQYLSKSSKGNPTYLLEVRDDNQDKSLWHVNLDNTFGKLATDTFTLPRNLVNKQLEIRLYIVTQGLSEQTLFVKNFFVF